MDFDNKTEKQKPRPRVHRILAYSYAVYLLALVLGLIFSATWPYKIFVSSILMSISSVILLLSSMLILWAQKSSKKFKKEDLTAESFKKGPYRFTRNPTNLGLFLSIICFGIIVNSVFVIIFAIIAFALSRFIFIKKEEELLKNKYGDSYLEYKKSVRF